jgi:hypothetical protein
LESLRRREKGVKKTLTIFFDINNTYLGFQAGEDTLYTFTFTHQNLDSLYSTVYLVDSLRGKTVDITASGSVYTFNVLPSDTIERRFKIVTSVDIATSLPTTNATVNRLKVFNSLNTLFVDNKTDDSGFLMLYDISGRFIQKCPFSANEILTLRTALARGSYLATAITNRDKLTTKLIFQ